MNIRKFEDKFIWLFVFCYFLELLSFPNTWVLIGGTIICTLLYTSQEILRIDIMVCLLTLTVVLYVGVDKGWGIAANTPFMYVLPITFVMAHYISASEKMNGSGDNEIIKLLLAMILGITIHGLLNSYMWLDGQWKDGNIRVWKEIWSDTYKYAAWQNSYYLPAMALFFPMIIYRKDNRKMINVFIVVSAVFFLYISLASQSRLTALMFPVVICLQSGLYIMLERKRFFEKMDMKRIIIAGVVLSILVVLAGVLLVNSSLGQEFLSIMNRDGGIFNNIRFKFQRKGLGQLFVYPFGGRQMDFMGYAHAHNAWIDVADAAGVIPFFAFIIYTFISVFELIRLLKSSHVSVQLKLIVFGLYSMYAMFFSIEAGLHSYDRYIVPWIFLQGMIHGYVSKEKVRSE